MNADQSMLGSPDQPFAPVIKPWMRLSASLHATGTPINDIAPQVGQSVEAISAFITSPPGREIVNTILSENQARIYDLLDAAAIDSLLTLIKVRDNPLSKPNDRIAAAKELLNRTLPGVKARDSKTREGNKSTSNDPLAEIEALENSLRSV